MPSLEKAPIVFHRRLAGDIYVMEYMSPSMAAEAQPGQFVNVRVGRSSDPLLRRPLSIHDVNAQTDCVSLLYRVAGRGTEMLSGLGINQDLDVMGPLGRGFTLAPDGSEVLLVGGGMGIAPLAFLARKLKEGGCEVTVLYGAESLEQAVALKFFRDQGIECRLATFDGSGGQPGFVTVLLDAIDPVPRYERLYCCGPPAMMRRVADWARRHRLPAEFSLEEHMACGVGSCLGCACQLRSDDPGYAKVCKDGPVFDLRRLGEIGGVQ